MPDDVILGGRTTENGEQIEDSVLLRRYAGNRAEDAFAELVRRHLDGVYSAALRRVGGDAHLARDVAQQVFVALARKAGPLSHHPLLASWLYVTTRHESANAVRSERRRKAREREAHTMQEILSDTEPVADWSRLAPMLDEAIDQLNEPDRAAVLLRFVERKPFAEIGAALRLSEDAARMRVDRALDRLRVRLGRQGIASTSAALGLALTNHAVASAPAGLAAAVTGAALTSAAVVTGPLALALQFMTTSKIALTVAGAALLAGWGTVTRESRAQRAAEKSLAAAMAESTRLDGRLREIRERGTAAEQAAAEAQASLAAVAQPPVRPAAPAPAAPADPLAAGKAFLAQHAEARQLWDERERANIAAKFAPIARTMNLTAEQQDRLADIVLRSMSGTTTLGGPGGNITLRREPGLTRAESEAQLQAVLGTEGYARFQELAPIAPMFDFTLKLATALYRTEPLRPDQTERVMQIFANASPAAKGRPPGPPAIDWNAIALESSGTLSSRQLAALDGVRRSFEYQQAIQRLGRAGMDAAVAPKTSTPPSR